MVHIDDKDSCRSSFITSYPYFGGFCDGTDRKAIAPTVVVAPVRITIVERENETHAVVAGTLCACYIITMRTIVD